VATVGLAGAGLVLAHRLAYAIAAPNEHARETWLRATGHGYLAYATQVALLAGALGLLAFFLSRLMRGEPRRSLAGDVARLAAVQAAAFLVMEVGERWIAGASFHDLTHGPLLVTGLGLQVATAMAGSLVLRATDRAAEAAEALERSSLRPLPALVDPGPVAPGVAATRWTATPVGSRAPPPSR
jgi:hypothetical protein